jgi:hypothetical protein
VTNEEIVKALRCCAKGLGHDDACENCNVGEIQDRREYIEFAAANMIERLTAENAALRKKLAMSDKDVTAAHLHFSQWQAAFIQLTQTVSRIEDEDKVGELCAAIKAQLAVWEKAMEGTP